MLERLDGTLSWSLNGDANGRHFNYTIQRSFQDSYDISDFGLNVSLQTGSMSSYVDGWYDKAQISPIMMTFAAVLPKAAMCEPR